MAFSGSMATLGLGGGSLGEATLGMLSGFRSVAISLVECFCVLVDLDGGDPIEGATISVELVGINLSASTYIVSPKRVPKITNSLGRVSFRLPPSSSYIHGEGIYRFRGMDADGETVLFDFRSTLPNTADEVDILALMPVA